MQIVFAPLCIPTPLAVPSAMTKPHNATLQHLLAWLKKFLPARLPINYREKLRACIGILGGLFMTGITTHAMVGNTAGLPLLIAPICSSAVLLFGVPSSPLAQPWAVVGGNVISALIGVTCMHFLSPTLLSAALAASLAVGAMIALRCLHPPGGAAALTAVLGGPLILQSGYQYVWDVVLVNSVLLMLFALLYNNLTGKHYPHDPNPAHASTHGTRDLPTIERLGFKSSDLDAVLAHFNEVVDISRDDLETLFRQTEMHAYRRRFGEILCADVMSTDVVTVQRDTRIAEAWRLLRRHRVKALPVVNGERHIVGIVTVVDFIKQIDHDDYRNFENEIAALRQADPLQHETRVAQIMSKQVTTVQQDMHIVELVPLLSDQGLHHIPVIDRSKRLVGMLTQSDLIAALYRGRLADSATDSVAG